MARRSARSLSAKDQLTRELEWMAMGIHPQIIPLVGKRERIGSDATSYRGRLLEPLPELLLTPGAVALSDPAPDPSEARQLDRQDSMKSMGRDTSIETQHISESTTHLHAINQCRAPQHAPDASTQSTSSGNSSSPRSSESFRRLNQNNRDNSRVIWTRANALVDSGYIHILIRRYCSTPESPGTPDASMSAATSNSTETSTSTPLTTPDSENMYDIAREDSNEIPSFSPSDNFTAQLEILYFGAHCLQEYCPNRECNEWRNEKRSLEWGLVEQRTRVKKLSTYNYSFFENVIDLNNLWPILNEMREENGFVEDSSACDESVAGDKGKGKAILSSGSSNNTSQDGFIEEDISGVLIQVRLEDRPRHVAGESSAQGSRGVFGLERPGARMSLPDAGIQGEWDADSADSNWRPLYSGSTPPLAQFEDSHTPEEIISACANQDGSFKLPASGEDLYPKRSTQDGRRQYEGSPLPEIWVGESSNRRPYPYSYDENVDVPRVTGRQLGQAMSNHSPGNDDNDEDDDDNEDDSHDKKKPDEANPGDGADDQYPHRDDEHPLQCPDSADTFKIGTRNNQDNTKCQVSPVSQNITVNLFYYLLAIPQDLQISMNGERRSDNDMAADEDDYEIMRALTQTIGNQIYWVLRVGDIQCLECVREIKKSGEMVGEIARLQFARSSS